MRNFFCKANFQCYILYAVSHRFSSSLFILWRKHTKTCKHTDIHTNKHTSTHFLSLFHYFTQFQSSSLININFNIHFFHSQLPDNNDAIMHQQLNKVLKTKTVCSYLFIPLLSFFLCLSIHGISKKLLKQHQSIVHLFSTRCKFQSLVVMYFGNSYL